MKNIIYNGDKVKNWSLIRKRILITVLIIWGFAVSYIFTYIGGYNNCNKRKEAEIISYKNEIYYDIFEINDDKSHNPYASIPHLHFVLDDEMSTFIIKLANKLELNPDFCIAILNTENWTLNPDTINHNENGTKDLGLWQINDSNLKMFGCKSDRAFDVIYWNFEEPFDPFNWKHSTWVAMHHIRDLCNQFDDFEKVAQAYNGGAGKVKRDIVPASAIRYGELVMSTYDSIKRS